MKETKEELIKQDLEGQELDVPENKKEKLIKNVTLIFTNPACHSSLEEIIKEESQELIQDWCSEWLEETGEQEIKMEAETWEEGEYDYLFNESNMALDYTFETDAPFLKKESYDEQELSKLSLELSNYIECKVSSGYGYAKDVNDYIDSFGELGEREIQLERGDNWTDIFYEWYDKLIPKNQRLLEGNFPFHGSLDDKYCCFYAYEGNMSPQWYVLRDELEEAIREAEKETNEND